MRQPVNDLGAPAFQLLPLQDITADLPVEQHQLAVDGQRGPGSGGADAGFQVVQKGIVAGR